MKYIYGFWLLCCSVVICQAKRAGLDLTLKDYGDAGALVVEARLMGYEGQYDYQRFTVAPGVNHIVVTDNDPRAFEVWFFLLKKLFKRVLYGSIARKAIKLVHL